MVEWASKRSASIGVSAADGMARLKLQARPTHARVAATLPYVAIALSYTPDRHCRNAFLIDLPVQRLHSALACIAICAVLLSERAAVAIRSATRYCSAPRLSVAVLHFSMSLNTTGRPVMREP
jgi:hypothetical protein